MSRLCRSHADTALETLRVLLADLHRIAELVDQSQQTLRVIIVELEAVRRALVKDLGPRSTPGQDEALRPPHGAAPPPAALTQGGADGVPGGDERSG